MSLDFEKFIKELEALRDSYADDLKAYKVGNEAHQGSGSDQRILTEQEIAWCRNIIANIEKGLADFSTMAKCQ